MTDHLPPDDLVGQIVERAATKVADSAAVTPHHHPIGMGLLVANLILVAALFATRQFDRNQIHDSERVLRKGVSCLLADLDDHRHTNQFAHNTLAEAEHLTIRQEDIIPLTAAQAQALKGTCQQFVGETLGNAAGQIVKGGRP